MKCNKIEKLIFMSGNGPLSQKDEASVHDHTASCARCHDLFSQQSSLASELNATPSFTMLPQDESDAIVRESLAKLLHPPKKERVAWLSTISMPKIAFAGLAAAFLLLVTLMVPNIHRIYTSAGQSAMHQHAYPQNPSMVSIDRDSTFAIGRYCVVRLKGHSSFTIVRGDEKVIRLILHSGKVFLSARKGFYDTIAVQAAGKEVFATGTHFKVERRNDDIAVEVLEGTVKVRTPEYEYPVEEHEKLTIADKDNKPALQGLLSEEQIALSKEFNGMAGLRAPSPSVNSDTRGPVRLTGTPKADMDNDSAALFEFLAAMKFVDQGNFLSASRIFDHYLKNNRRNADSAWFELGYCYTILHRYKDALSAYRKVVATGLEGSLVETSLHRINKLLYLKFKNYDEAGESIAGYLSRYPRGRWRDEEMFLYIQIKLYYNDSTAVDSMTQLYSNEFPHNCRVKELSEKIKSSRR